MNGKVIIPQKGSSVATRILELPVPGENQTFEVNAPLALFMLPESLSQKTKGNTVVHGLFPTPNGVASQIPGVRPCECNEQGRHPGYAERRMGYHEVVTSMPQRMPSPDVTPSG